MKVYYVICVGERRADVGKVACLKVFESLARALDECGAQMLKLAGEFMTDWDESDHEHVQVAWSSPTQTIWLERLGLVE